jgi:uncharacterized protein
MKKNNMKHAPTPITTYWLWIERLVISLLVVIGITCISTSSVYATGVYDLPNPNVEDVWVVDTADAISFANQTALTGTLKNLAKETGKEIRMVAIRRLDYGETIDSLADELFSTWYPDASARANQTLLVMDTLTNNAAIRNGEANQALVDENIAKSIIDETIGYNLRKGNKYNQAFIDSSDRLVAILSGQADPGPPAISEEVQIEGTFTKAEDTDAGNATVWVIVLLLLATVIPMVTYFWYVGLPGK